MPRQSKLLPIEETKKTMVSITIFLDTSKAPLRADLMIRIYHELDLIYMSAKILTRFI
jgi:hypothetical protein